MEVENRMKKFLLLIVFIVISLPCFSEEIANPSIANTGFDIILERSGETDYYFTEYNSNVRLERVVFSLILTDDSDNEYSEAELGFHYQIYNTGNYTVKMIFEAEDNSSHMLKNTDINAEEKNKWLDYTVSASGDTVETNIESNDTVDTKIESNNVKSLTIYSGMIDSNTGVSGNVNLALRIDAPTWGNENAAFFDGQYTGRIVVEVIKH